MDKCPMCKGTKQFGLQTCVFCNGTGEVEYSAELKKKVLEMIDGWAIYRTENVNEVCRQLGIAEMKPDVKWTSKEDAYRQGMTYVDSDSGEAIWALLFAYHVCAGLDVDASEAKMFMGRGFQARRLEELLRKHWGMEKK